MKTQPAPLFLHPEVCGNMTRTEKTCPNDKNDRCQKYQGHKVGWSTLIEAIWHISTPISPFFLRRRRLLIIFILLWSLKNKSWEFGGDPNYNLVNRQWREQGFNLITLNLKIISLCSWMSQWNTKEGHIIIIIIGSCFHTVLKAKSGQKSKAPFWYKLVSLMEIWALRALLFLESSKRSSVCESPEFWELALI